ncbi:MAG: macro domain-containing protein, partial [Clostridium sp.]
SAEALVNTVNCEGYMGKGIAYQFKLQYPENNIDYVKACKKGTLTVGKLHYFKEKGKLIINFPTKNTWRAKSKMQYVEDGLDALIQLVNQQQIKSIAIPPLGSGNGGLIWAEVKAVIEEKLSVLHPDIQVYIYEPSQNYVAQPTVEPKLSMSALVLMQVKQELNKFDTLRLQKTAYFINIFASQNYFNFKRHKYGPYDNSIAIISRNIKEFQKYHNVKNTHEAYRILYNKIVSGKVEANLKELMPFIHKAAEYVNEIDTNHELECLATIIFLIQEKRVLSETEILQSFKAWSEDKAIRFSEEDIRKGIKRLNETSVIENTLTGYSLIQ